MEEIGGYFAKLSLITDGASFDKARQYLDGIGPAADKSAAAIRKLEAAYGGFSNASGFYLPNKHGTDTSPVNLPLKPVEDEAPKENERKKSALTAASMLYVAKEVVAVAKKIISGIDKLASASVAQTAATTQNAVRTGFSTEALNKWQSTLGVLKVDFGAFTSSITGVETAFNRLKVGDASAFNAIAQPLAILASKTGRADVNPVTMMGMDNEQRIKAILDAALSMSDTKTARTLVEQILGDVGGELYAAALARGVKSTAGLTSLGGIAVKAPTQEEIDAADTYSRTQQNLQTFLKTFGQGLTLGLKPSLDKVNKLLGTESTMTGSENLGRIIGELLGPVIVAMALLTKALTTLAELLDPAKRTTDPRATALKGAPAPAATDSQNYLDWQLYNNMGSDSYTSFGDIYITVPGGTGMTPTELAGAVKDGVTAAGKRAVTAPPAGKPVLP